MRTNRHLDPAYFAKRRRRLCGQGRCPECAGTRENTTFVLCTACRAKRAAWWRRTHSHA